MDHTSGSLNFQKLAKEPMDILKQCPLCNKNYQSNIIKIIADNNNQKLCHLTCPHCNSSLLIITSLTQIGAGLIALVTDLGTADARKFYLKQPLSQNQLLDTYNIIHTNQLNKFLNKPYDIFN